MEEPAPSRPGLRPLAGPRAPVTLAQKQAARPRVALRSQQEELRLLGGSVSVGGTGAAAGGSSASGSAVGGSNVTAGGTQAVGGINGAGGSEATGGTTVFGGTGGSVGGGTSAGGAASIGGTVETGGIVSTGGATSAEGVSTTGGAPSTGGSVATGGTTSTGGTIASGNTGGAVSTGGVATGGAATGGAATGGATYCTIAESSGPAIYQDGSTNTANACQICDVTVSTTAWYTMPEGAACGTAGGAVCHANACVSGCFIGSTYYAANASNGPCQTCQPTASTTAWSSNAASCGCTGTYETVQSTTGLCVAKMVPITAPSASNNYSIDATEVTKGQYDLWLGTKPALPASTDRNCSYVTTYAEQASGGTLFTGTDAAHHPVANVDWCDAYTYCKGVGKRLCGAIGGGTNAYASYADATLSQWYRACSSGGADTYPYGNTYQATYCDGVDYGTSQTVAVGSLTSCVTSATGYAGAYDLSGNVWEWEDSCSGTGQSAGCRFRGGAFGGYSSYLPCSFGDYAYARSGVNNGLGFRCCSP